MNDMAHYSPTHPDKYDGSLPSWVVNSRIRRCIFQIISVQIEILCANNKQAGLSWGSVQAETVRLQL